MWASKLLTKIVTVKRRAHLINPQVFAFTSNFPFSPPGQSSQSQAGETRTGAAKKESADIITARPPFRTSVLPSISIPSFCPHCPWPALPCPALPCLLFFFISRTSSYCLAPGRDDRVSRHADGQFRHSRSPACCPHEGCVRFVHWPFSTDQLDCPSRCIHARAGA